ncbi:hypothetical protein N800_00455 [Lysobacter daejeonensis GH1-9]|uniref:SLH domain-containing protein n=1 Tax=Lysobacter daejeonensis GH1-9 TaxID=1385517 RepID=A0A0A0EXX6_9GAMM|nr:hypothetical protein N800_00455 [Lysobacter daejeonensis GH1-9]
MQPTGTEGGAPLQSGTDAAAVESVTIPVVQPDGSWPADARVRFSDWVSIESDTLPSAAVDVVSAGGRLYTLGEFGAIYQSTDEGGSWRQVAHVQQPQALSLKQLAAIPETAARPVVFFATDSTSSARLYRISDGETQPVTLGDPRKPWENSVWRIATIGQYVYAAAELGVYRTDDAGATWTRLLATTSRCKDIVGAGDRLYASCDGLYRSTNGGAFELVDDQSELRGARLAMSPASQDLLYATSYFGVFRSSDAGLSWKKTIDFSDEANPVHLSLFGELEAICASSSPAPWFENIAFAVDPDNPWVVWLGYKQLYRSDDGGEHFGRASVSLGSTAVEHRLPQRISKLLFQPTGLYVTTARGIYRSTNRHAAVQLGDDSICSRPDDTPEVAWAPMRLGINGQQFRHVSVAGDGSILATTSTHQGFYFSDLDAPGDWLQMAEQQPYRFFVSTSGGIDRFYASPCQTGTTCRFDADETQWSTTNVAEFGFGGLAYIAPDPSEPARAWAGIGSAIYRSDDGLATGTLIGYAPGCSPARLIAVSPVDSNIVLVATPCAVSRRSDALSLDGEASWAAQTLRPSPVTFNDMLFDQAEPRRVFLTARGEPAVFLSQDAGISWRSLDAPGAADGLPDGNVSAIAIDPVLNDIVYLGTEQGELYVGWNVDATDAGTRVWHAVASPFRGAPIVKLAVWQRVDGSKGLYIFTAGAGMWSVTLDSAPYADVGFDDWSFDYVRRLSEAGVTNGCSKYPSSFCPEQPVLREQMAVFLLRAIHGSAYRPPSATGHFLDVPVEHWASEWIEQLRREGMTNGCSLDPPNYCPSQEVPREQIAVFLLRAKHGVAYQPPPPTGLFEDVPTSHWAAAWIEQLAREGIANGCAAAPARYCPSESVTREQMAAFLVRTFGM